MENAGETNRTYDLYAVISLTRELIRISLNKSFDTESYQSVVTPGLLKSGPE
jgi:hypothetical protein